MVSGTEIRKAEKRRRQKTRATAARFSGAAVAIVIAFIPNRAQWGVALGLGIAAGCLIYGLSQSDWIVEADLPLKRWARFLVGSVITIGGAYCFGMVIWPPIHRHALSKKERKRFEEPLKNFKNPKMSIHLACAPYDEVDCVYAADLIPLFGEAGWDVSTIVERVTLGRPKPGIIIGLHGTVKLEDEPKLKWNEGEWTKIPPEEEVVREAFLNVGIEPDSTSGAIIPENQMNIYVGHERENELSPTDLTQMFENLERARREHPETQREPSAK